LLKRKSSFKAAVTAREKEGMGTEAAGSILAERMAQLKQGLQANTAQIIAPEPQKIDTRLIAVKPIAKNWEQLLEILEPVLDADGLYRRCLLITIRELYEQGYSAELETMAELAKKLANKQPPSHYFARSISKRSGNWATKTLSKVHETWEVRKTALEVMERLKLDATSTNYVLSLAWKFKGTLMRFLGIATEQGYGIKNPAGYFFGIVKNTLAAAT
jgi:hypothetical protein